VKDHRHVFKKLSCIKHKEVLRETLHEYSRKGSFIRIYPAKGTECYDPYFQQPRPLNRFLYKMLFTDELTASPPQTPSVEVQMPPPKVETKNKGEAIVVQLRKSQSSIPPKTEPIKDF